MMKAMLSQPMAGKTDEEIIATREKAIKVLQEKGYEIVNTLFTDEWYSKESMEERGVVQIPLCFLAKSLENMSLCHAAYFCKGYVAGDVTLEYETKKCTYDRGRMFTVDAMDNIESAGVAFGRLSGEFLRTQVVPELDAWRLASYAGYATNKVAGAIADAKAGIAAIRKGKTAIENAEAKPETCYLFISNQLKGDIEDLDTTASKKVLDGWAGVIPVPEGRFYDKITLTASGAGGFATAGGKKIDFLIVDKNAVIQNQKHTVSKIITPDQNQDADAWKFGYRTVGIAEAKDNKKVAIYAHTAAE